jgi:hypothetical protein
MKRIAISQSNYIPWKGYFDLINSVDEFVLYDDMQFTRRDWRNRNQIKTPQGVQWLTIPVKVKGTGHSAATISLIAMGGVVCCIYALVRSKLHNAFSSITALRLSVGAAIAVLLAIISIERGLVRVESPSGNLIPASAADIWKQVRVQTEKNALVFTDQTSPTNWDMLGGWNNFALSGERQIYVANWVQTSLRSNSTKRDEVFTINNAVLSGLLSPDKVSTSRTYSEFVAVVSARKKYAIFVATGLPER